MRIVLILQPRHIRVGAVVGAVLSALAASGVACAQVAESGRGERVVRIDRERYEDCLRGMWLAQLIGNWTGLSTEGGWTEPPFLTDADWGTMPKLKLIDFVVDQDPWGADDDTDIEYVYLHLLDWHAASAVDPLVDGVLTADQIAAGWQAHINDFIWVSNANARALMDLGVQPPATSLPAANPSWAMIDAQLTTEIFGALNPGMPGEALRQADLAIHTTARGHAAHAAQFHAALYSLAPIVDGSMATDEQALWLIGEARKLIPNTSKAADIIDTVRSDFLSNPDKDDWERTRDLVYQRYQLDSAANGFVYRNWYESSVNLATGVMALLYGEMDLRRTIQIATLSGWDSDNPAATMAGVIGMAIGFDAVAGAFPGESISERYWIARTRDAMPDFLPGDPEAEDTTTMIATRMLSHVDRNVRAAGGRVLAGEWVIPLVGGVKPASVLLAERSANVSAAMAGQPALAFTNVGPSDPDPVSGRPAIQRIGNSVESDASGVDWAVYESVAYSSHRAPGATAGAIQRFSVSYADQSEIYAVRLVEGGRFTGVDLDGGWFEAGSLEVSVRVAEIWTPVCGTWIGGEPDPGVPFEIKDFVLDVPILGDGVRIGGIGGGADSFVTICEIDALSGPLGSGRGELGPIPWDIDGDGAVDRHDLFSFMRQPVDVTGDGVVDAADIWAMEQATRWIPPPGKQSRPMQGRRLMR